MIFTDKNIKVTKFYYTLHIVLLTPLFFYFYSCGEDSVVNNNNNEIPVVDSNFFSWSYVPVPGWNFYDSYIADTNSLFYILDGNVFYYNGKTSIQIYSDLIDGEALSIYGHGTDQVYNGGYLRNNNTSTPWFKKWNGFNLENINLPIDSNRQINEICVESENSTWLAGESGRIYNYNGNVVTPYFIDMPNTYPHLFLKDNQIHYYTQSPESYPVCYVYIFNNNNWEFVNADTSRFGLVFSGTQLIKFGNHALRKAPGYLLEFNNQNWIPFVNTPTFEAYSVSGNSLTDFLCIGIPEGTLEFFPYYYNGEKWFKQDRAIPENIFYGFPVELKYCKGVYFGFYYAIELVSHNYILVGKMNTPPGK